jgi:hypothetical protein
MGKLAEGPRFRDTFTSRSALSIKLLEAKISSALVEHISVAMAPLGLSVSVASGRVTLAGTTRSEPVWMAYRGGLWAARQL